MNDTTTAAINILRDTLRVHDTLRVSAAETAVNWFEIAKYVVSAIVSLASILGLWKYAFHARKVAKEDAFVGLTSAQHSAEAEVMAAEAKSKAEVIEAAAKSNAAIHSSHKNVIDFWGEIAEKLQTQNDELNASLKIAQSEVKIAQSEVIEATRKLAFAEGTIELLNEKVKAQDFEILSLKERLAADAEILKEKPLLQKMVKELLEEKRLLYEENQRILNELSKLSLSAKEQ